MRLDLSLLLLACLTACGGQAKDPVAHAADTDPVVDNDDSDAGASDTDGDTADCPVLDDTAPQDPSTTDSGIPTDTSTRPDDTSADTGPLKDTADTDLCDDQAGDTDSECGTCPTGTYCAACLALDDDGYPTTIYDCIPCGVVCGRPLRTDRSQDEPDRAALVARGDWTGEPLNPDLTGLTAAEIAALAEHWGDQALDEHASIGSFARFTLELLAHGAPERLVRAAQQAGLDEAHHAREAFALASAFAGAPQGPSGLDGQLGAMQLAEDLTELAVATLLDGCLNETLATALATAQRDAATDPAVRAVLQRVVDDETRHARLAWETVAWALERGDEPVRQALIQALAAYRLPSPRPVTHPVPSHGLLDDETSRAALELAWAQVIVPVVRALLPGAPC